MKLIRIKDHKDFMGKLLNSDCFDSFLLYEASIRVSCSYVIDGKQNKDFYTMEDRQMDNSLLYPYTEWKQIRLLCFQLIKGKRAPISFHFILFIKPEIQQKLLKITSAENGDTNVSQLILNIKYDSNGLFLTTGISYSEFTMNKENELLWDKNILQFLSLKQISFEES